MTDQSERRVTIPRQMCEVKDGRFVDPCTRMMASQFDCLQSVDLRTKTPIRTVIGAWAEGQFFPFKVCPFCAADLPKSGA